MFIYGRNSVEEAIEEKIKICRILMDRDRKAKFSLLFTNAQRAGIPIELVSERDLARESGSQKHQGIVAEIELPPTVYEREEDFSRWESCSVVLMLDGLTDTGNVGAIIRSALLFGVDVVVLPEDHSARITPHVMKASAGSIYRIPVVYVRHIVRTTEMLKERGFTVYGLDMYGEERLGQVKFAGPICVVVGSEDRGIRRMMKRTCEHMIRIPTTGKLDSLNASVATAVCLWEIYKQRQGGNT